MQCPTFIRVFLTFCLLAGAAACSHSETEADNQWDPKAAASYLDSRQNWWMSWPGAARDHNTFCVSCHTAVPYALSRPALRGVLGEVVPSVPEQKLLQNVRKRVRSWKDVEPFYKTVGNDPKGDESRGTEAILNALVLSSDDALNGKLTADTVNAFENMWALQQATGHRRGAWSWLLFDLEPWEANESQYYGAALAAIAVGTAPENYARRPEIQDHLELLREYLLREYPNQSVINRAVLLWASAKVPGLLEPKLQQSIVDELLSHQQADGGWRLSSLAWRWTGLKLFSITRIWVRQDGTPMERRSDGYATGLITFGLEQAGVPVENAQLQKALSWLRLNQNKTEGFWSGYSLNKSRNPSSGTGRFMSDAATAYAVLALSRNN